MRFSSLQHIPGGHLAAILVLSVVLLGVASWPEAPQPAAPVETPVPETAIIADHGAEPAPATTPEPEAAPPEPPANTITAHEVRRGDNLSALFKRAGRRQQELANMLAEIDHSRDLRKMMPGQFVEFEVTPEDQLAGLRWLQDPLTHIAIRQTETGFESERIERAPEVRVEYASGTIQDSLFLDGRRAGLSDRLIMEFAAVFQWDIDFVLDLRKGDAFSVTYETHWLDDEQIGTGAILAARFTNRRTVHDAVRYVAADGRADFYSPDGHAMRKAFIRAPVEFTRISSNFNLRRRHPLHNTTMPHRGIDYAAPTGTPVIAAGDGRVETATRNKASGKFVVIRHTDKYTTKYLHLSNFARGVRSGKRVRQGQVIGYVGQTGWATGPHLHYEFLVNGVHQNPRTVPLPKVAPIADAERGRFEAATRPLLAALDAGDRARDQATALAGAPRGAAAPQTAAADE